MTGNQTPGLVVVCREETERARISRVMAKEAERVLILKAEFVLYHAFWATILLSLKVSPSRTLATFAATDCVRNIWYNPLLTKDLTLPQFGFVLIHELGHCVFLHHTRRGSREPLPWAYAEDHVVNLIASGVVSPKGREMYDPPLLMGGRQIQIYMDEKYRNWAAEPVYEDILEERRAEKSGGDGAGKEGSKETSGTDQSPGSESGDVLADQNGSGVGNGAQDKNGTQDPGGPDLTGAVDHGGIDTHIPQNLTEDEKETARDRVLAAYAAWQSSSQRGYLPGGLLRYIRKIGSPAVPWERTLHQWAGQTLAKEDYTLFPPHKRYLMEGFVVPSLRSLTLGRLAFLMDVSGSVTSEMLEEFSTEIAKLSSLAEECLLLGHDAEVHEVIKTADIPRWLTNPALTGGGGTSHKPAFEYLDKIRYQPDLVICFTDLETEFPDKKPPYPVLWCVPEPKGGNGHLSGSWCPPEVPWGKVVVIPATGC